VRPQTGTVKRLEYGTNGGFGFVIERAALTFDDTRILTAISPDQPIAIEKAADRLRHNVTNGSTVGPIATTPEVCLAHGAVSDRLGSKLEDPISQARCTRALPRNCEETVAIALPNVGMILRRGSFKRDRLAPTAAMNGCKQ